MLKKLEVTAEDAKSLIQKIPTETDALFAYEVDWEQFEKVSVECEVKHNDERRADIR